MFRALPRFLAIRMMRLGALCYLAGGAFVAGQMSGDIACYTTHNPYFWALHMPYVAAGIALGGWALLRKIAHALEPLEDGNDDE